MTEKQKEYFKEYRKRPEVKEKQKGYMIKYLSKPEVQERIKEYRKKRYEEHREEINKKAREYNRANPDKIKKAYEKFKETHNWSKYCGERRKARVERLKAQGCTNAWYVCTRGDKPIYKEEEK